MRIIGLTGGIGSGKSTVARLFEALGAEVVDADILAREAVAPGTAALSLILDRFGEGIVDNNGALDRQKLGQIVFGDEQARRDLNAIVHPEVASLAQARFRAAASRKVPLVIYDVPLLFENGLEDAFSSIVVVYAPKDVRVKRLVARDGLTERDIHARMAAQMALEDKVGRADHVIDNTMSQDELRQRVASLYQTLLSEDEP